MDNSRTAFTRPQFVELPPVKEIEVVHDGDVTGVDVSYVSPEGRTLTIRIVLNADQAKELSQQLT